MIIMKYKNEKYIIVFSSNYHGYYIEELLRRNEIPNTLRKAPRAIAKSCHTAIYILENDFKKVIKLIMDTKIKPTGVYEVIWIEGVATYRKVPTNKG